MSFLGSLLNAPCIKQGLFTLFGGNSNVSQFCVSSVFFLSFVCIALTNSPLCIHRLDAAKESRRPLYRFIDLFLCITLSSLEFGSTNSSPFILDLDFYFLNHETIGLNLFGIPSLCHGSEIPYR